MKLLEIIPLNITVLAISLTNIEVVLKISLLLITIFISIYNFIKKNK
tara:strand:- start:20 stop:160 length:141 start_codon:yes stop_codon:yes gene_type:complete